MATEQTRQGGPPANAPRAFPPPTNLILGCAFAGTLLFWWVLVHLLVAAFAGQDNWALDLVAAILAAMIGTLAGIVVWARQLQAWARSVEARKAEPPPAGESCGSGGRAADQPAARGPPGVTGSGAGCSPRPRPGRVWLAEGVPAAQPPRPPPPHVRRIGLAGWNRSGGW